MQASPIIGFLAQKSAGKDTAADYIVKTYGWKKTSFATPLKEATRAMFGFTDEQLYGNKKEEVDEYWGVTPRAMFQYFGTDVCRKEICDDFWIKSFMRKNKDEKNIIVADVRFQNELDAIHALGGVVFKINRPSLPIDPHISESGISTVTGYDQVIDNIGTVELFFDQVDQTFRRYEFKKSSV